MPRFEHDSTSIYFEEHGSGFPVLLIAPGAMDSTIEMWASATVNPLALYADNFRLIAIDQRNAGRSYGPLEPSDPWGAYGISDGNGPLYEQMWRSWGARLSSRPDLSRDDSEAFGTRMWRDDFVVSVSRDYVRACTTPLLVLPGTDRVHPRATGREVAALASAGEFFEPWDDSPQRPQRQFAVSSKRTYRAVRRDPCVSEVGIAGGHAVRRHDGRASAGGRPGWDG